MSKESGVWPDGSKGTKPLYYCSECGCWGVRGGRHAAGCLGLAPCVPVLPAPIAEELAEQAEAVLGTVEGIERRGEAGPMEEFEESCHELADALTKYHAALGEERIDTNERGEGSFK